MSDDFDPYYKWLGIGPEERPASHYRLLSIRDFEPDPEVIESAADRQMGHVRSFQTGAHSADSQRLLNELSAARLCLLNPAKKALYDGQLRRLLAALNAADVAQPLPKPVLPTPPPSAIVDKTEVLSDIIASSARRTHPVVEKMQSWQGPVITALVATLIVLGLGVAYRLIVYQEVSVVPKDSATQASSGGSSENRDQAAGEPAGNKVAEPERPKQEKAQVRAPLRDQWIDLLAGVNVERSRIDGDWRRVSDGVTMGRRWGTSRLQVLAGMTAGYEAELVFRRTDGKDSVLLIFPVGTAHCTFYLYDPSKDYYAKSGLGDVDGKGTSKNGTGFRAKFESNRDHDLRLVVRHFTNKWSIQVFLDGDRVVDWDGPQSVLTTPNEWNIPESGAFGLAGFDVAVIFRAFHIRGKPNPDAVPSAPLSATSTDLVPPRPAGGTGLPENVWIRIVNRNSRMGIGVREDKKSAGADVIQWEAGAEWMLCPHGDFWSIQDHNSGLYLAVMKSSREQGAAICVESEGSGSSQWIIEPTDPPFWKIVNRNSGFALAIPQGQRNRGAVACQWPFWSGSDQQWEFKVEAPAPLRAEADAWKTKAERFAREHLGRFIDGKPLIEGLAEVPLDILSPAPATATWFLGNGRIYLDNATYSFGEGFEKDLPEVRYEIPALAAALHLKSAFVQLHPRGDVLQIVVGGVPADPPGASEAEKRARIADLKRRIEMLNPRLRAYRRPNTPDEQKDKAFQAIIELAEIKFPQVPPRPNPGDPKYKNRPDLYNADVQAYKNVSAQNDAVREAVPEIGTRKLREYQQTLASLQKEPGQAVSQAGRENDPSLTALKQRCRSISALIYQPVLRGGESAPAADKTSHPPDKAVGPAVPASPPATLKLHWNGGTNPGKDAPGVAATAPDVPDIGLPTAPQAVTGSRTPIKPNVVPPLVIDLQEPIAHCSVDTEQVTKGMILLEITKLEGSADFEKDFTVEKPKPLRLGSPGILKLTMKGYPKKVNFPIIFVTSGKGFYITLEVGSKIAAACKNPRADVEAAKKELRKNRDEAHGKMERAKGKEKLALTHIVEVCDRALASLDFFSEVNKVKVHFRVCLDTGDQHPTVIATTEGP